jgi:uncharacterized repeat protein (TIGR03803 family)
MRSSHIRHALFGFFGLLFVSLGLSQPAGAAAYKVLHQFCADNDKCKDGFALLAPLIRDAGGNLYGVAESGGAFGSGTLFRISPAKREKWKLTVLHDFCALPNCSDGFDPVSPVIIDAAGNLYGVVDANVGDENGDALIYELVKPSNDRDWEYKILYRFCVALVCDGAFPRAGLSYEGQASGAPYDGKSVLFGAAAAGGANDQGVAFTLKPRKSGWTHTDIYSFCAQTDCTDGGNPIEPFIVKDANHLIGVTSLGGAGGSGVAFTLTKTESGWQQNVLYTFCSLKHCADGSGSPSSLVADAAGNLYGTTPTGGSCMDLFACGTIFRIAPDGTETVLFDFCKKVGGCKVGSDPEAGLALGDDGTLYGTTVAGGAPGRGVIFSFDGKIKNLHEFCDQGCDFGGNSRSPIILDPDGNLFGVTPQGDTSGGGVIYELTP